MIAGAVLLGAELTFVNAQFYLVFIGSAAIITGVVTALTAGLAAWAQWATFAVLALASMLTFRSRLYRRLHSGAPPVDTGPAGAVITLPAALAPGESCQAEHGGSFWTVRNIGNRPLPAAGRARVARVDGLTLLVEPES
jgi:membrane protein implicated in regulation of membrane protease activity